MTFRDIRQGYNVYMFDKDSLTAYEGKVTSVSQPRFSQPQTGQPINYTCQAAQMVIDVTIEANGQARTYEIPESSSMVNAAQLVLSVDRNGILREVEAVKSRSEEVLRDVEKHQKTIRSCNQIIEDWNPDFAEKRKQDERIAGLEGKMDKISEMLAAFLAEQKK